MILLQYSLLILLFLINNLVYLSYANQQTDPDSEVIKSLSTSYSRKSDDDDILDVFVKNKVKQDDRAHDFSTKRINQLYIDASTEANIQYLKEAKNKNISKSFDDLLSQSTDNTEEDEDLNKSSYYGIPFSEHENPKEPATRPNYTFPGEWAKPPANKNISLDFVPSKLYAQVRGTHTIKHLPREEAIKSAENNEEKENAARLKEVVKISKSNTIYTEEGYEDAAYDHAGQIRDANFHEGYDKILKDNLNIKKVNPKNKSSESIKDVHKRNKTKFQNLKNLNSDFDDLTKEIGKTRIHNQKLIPINFKTLKNKRTKPVIDPKSVVQQNILQLEQDLKKVSYETEYTPTESYYTTISTLMPLLTEAYLQNKIDYGSTTLKPIVYTIKSRKSATKSNENLRPMSFNTKLKDNTINKYYVNNSFKKKPTSKTRQKDSRQYFANKKKQTLKLTPSPEYYKSRITNTNIFGSLASGTLNDYGPSLLAVTDLPNTFTTKPLQTNDSESMINRVYVPLNTISKPNLTNYFMRPDPYLKTNIQNVQEADSYIIPRYTIHKRNENPNIFKENKMSKKSFRLPGYEISKNHAKILKYLQNENKNLINYYNLNQSSMPSYSVVTYPNHLRETQSNTQNYWPLRNKSEKPIKGVYDFTNNVQRLHTDSSVQESVIPVTKLLPPAPLSTSEYSSFLIEGKKSESMRQSITNIVPIIAAIHRHKNNQKPIPFLFRKKRSLGPSREWEILQKEKYAEKKSPMKNLNTDSSKSDKITISSYPSDFYDILNETPKIASIEIQKEIAERFKNISKNESRNDLDDSSNEESSEGLSMNFETIVTDHLNSNDKNEIKVAVPELNFDSILENDDIESITVKSNIDINKYPFYQSNKISKNNAIKYIVNPIEVPQKTFGGMEFYDSRDLKCDNIDLNFEKIIPEEGELSKKRGMQRDPKLHGLGNKLDCYKAKYFDIDPLDNPLFLEKVIELPSPPTELNAKDFSSRIFDLSPENDKYIIPRGPKYPEDYSKMKELLIIKKAPNHNYSEQNDNKIYDTSFDKPDIIEKDYLRYRKPSDYNARNANRMRMNKIRQSNLINNKSRIIPTYQRQVYEDVMGTIMNFENRHITPLPGNNVNYMMKYFTEKKNLEFDKLNKQKQKVIDGLIPPPRYIVNTVLLNNKKFPRSNWRNTRIFKRSAAYKNIEQINNSLNHSNNFKDVRKNTFRIILTTPNPEKFKRKRKTASIIYDESTTSQRPIYTINDRIKSINQPSDELGKYYKFVDKINRTSSIDSRRREPKYNVIKRTNVIKNYTYVTTPNPTELIFSTIPSQLSTNSSLSRSTLIPIIVNPEANVTAGIPIESKTSYIKKKLTNIDKKDSKTMINDFLNNSNENQEESENSEKPENQYLVYENIQEDEDKKVNEGEAEADFRNESNYPEELRVLKEDPPGYYKTFKNYTIPKNEESKSNESMESKGNNSYEEEEEEEAAVQMDEEDNSKEQVLDESDNSEDNSKTNIASDNNEENLNNSLHKIKSKPFRRYLTRPRSSPENYEDERFSDLGPRINKPYFYHPSFHVPEYEKYKYGKSVEHSNDDSNDSEEIEDHEAYLFPWEYDSDDEEKLKELDNYSVFSKYEFPWEKREKKEKEKRKKEKLQRRYNKKILNSQEDQNENEEATNTKSIYIPLRNDHSRNKKNVNRVKKSSNNEPVIIFNSKYKSKIIEDPIENGSSISKNNKETIINYFQNSSSLAPKIKASQKLILNNLHSLNTTLNLPIKNKYFNQIEYTTSKLPIGNYTAKKSVIIGENGINRSVTSSPKHQARARSRRIKANINYDNDIDKIKLIDQKIDGKNLPAHDSKLIPTRGRSKSISDIDTYLTTPKSSVKSKSRRRNIIFTSTTIPTIISRTLKNASVRRKRPIKVNTSMKLGNNQSKKANTDSTILPSILTPTGRTIEHHSRVSKKEIITKTFYPEVNEEDEEDDINENSSQYKDKSNLKTNPTDHIKIKLRSKPKNDSGGEHAKKKETVEKVTITMEKTPNHVLRTKEIDKDGVKGKLITISSNNNSVVASKRSDDPQMRDAEIEEMKRRLNAFSSFESINRYAEDLVDEPSKIDRTENHVVGNLRNLPVPTTRESQIEVANDTHSSECFPIDEQGNIEYNDDSNDDDNDLSNDDDDDDDEDYYRNINNEHLRINRHKYDKSDHEDTRNDCNEDNLTEKNVELSEKYVERLPANVIKDPNSRRYFYVKSR